MALSPEYAELRTRCITAASRGYQIGRAEQHVADLQTKVGEPTLPQGTTLNSPDHLLFLLNMLDKGEMAVKAPKAAPRKAPEPPPVVEVQEVAEVAEVAETPTPEPPEPSKPTKKGRR